MEYISSVMSAMLTTVFFVFAIAALGYLVGGIKIKGISLGTAGVLLVALVFGIVAHYHPYITIGSKDIALYLAESTDKLAANKSMFSMVSNVGTAMFVTAVGLIAGPKFFRNFNKKSISYIILGVIIISVGAAITLCIIKIGGIDSSLAVGLMTGALTSTPGLSAAKEAASNADSVTAGYGIAYLVGVLGVVFVVQLIPKITKVNIEEERKTFIAANSVSIKPIKRKLHEIDSMGFFPFVLTIALGMIIGSFKIPGINFSLGSSGGTLIAGLIIGHFGHIGPIDCRIDKSTLNFFRELGLMLFLIGAGVPGGANFISYVSVPLFVYGALITLIPMFVGYFISKYVFKLSIFNNLGSITGGMTSTPALGCLISVAGTDEVTFAYAATYPIALVMVVILSKLLVMFF